MLYLWHSLNPGDDCPGMEHLDVLVVGAGVSGIAAAYHLLRSCPDKSFGLLEAREASGGTWDLFRYPGIRSDSDMYSFAFSFQPWRGEESIASGPAILRYLRDTARTHGIDGRIRFGHRLVKASWDSASARWIVQVELHGRPERLLISCNFLFMCSGYYSYDQPHRPAFAGEGDFRGVIAHPQCWPDGLDYRDKRVVIIGSGATAVTMVPAMAGDALHVTMLQRSPGFLVARPSRDRLANALRKLFPRGLGNRLARLKFLLRDMAFYQLATRLPWLTRGLLLGMLRWKIGAGHDIARDFSPRYLPWSQRLCLVPDGDLFASLRSRSASVVTGDIDCFVRNGIRLQSGEELPADIIVTATGLTMRIMDGVELEVDGKPVSIGESTAYKGCMYSGVPNLASSFGYANAAWTLKAELTCEFVCRLLAHMQRSGFDTCVARAPAAQPCGAPLLNLSSGYVARALDGLPRQGLHAPWKALSFYPSDWLFLRHGRLEDGVMEWRASASAG